MREIRCPFDNPMKLLYARCPVGVDFKSLVKTTVMRKRHL